SRSAMRATRALKTPGTAIGKAAQASRRRWPGADMSTLRENQGEGALFTLSREQAELKGTGTRDFFRPRVDRAANPSRISIVNREYRSQTAHDRNRHSYRLADAQSAMGIEPNLKRFGFFVGWGT